MNDTCEAATFEAALKSHLSYPVALYLKSNFMFNRILQFRTSNLNRINNGPNLNHFNLPMG